MKRYALGIKANSFLKRHIHLLPQGKALDIATGEGRNAVFLAEHGFDVVKTPFIPWKTPCGITLQFLLWLLFSGCSPGFRWRSHPRPSAPPPS